MGGSQHSAINVVLFMNELELLNESFKIMFLFTPMH